MLKVGGISSFQFCDPECVHALHAHAEFLFDAGQIIIIYKLSAWYNIEGLAFWNAINCITLITDFVVSERDLMIIPMHSLRDRLKMDQRN